MQHKAIGWFEIYVQDMERAKAFYQTVFDTSLERLPVPDLEMWAFQGPPEAPGASGALVHMQGAPSGGNSTLVYFNCEDCAVEEARVTNSGGKIHRGKLSIGEFGFISLVVDTEGNMIGLHSMK